MALNLSHLTYKDLRLGSPKTETPRSPSPFYRAQGKRLRTSEDAWLPSPGHMSVDSLSPSPGAGPPNGHPYSVSTHNGFPSPMSASSYDPYSPPNGKIGECRFFLFSLVTVTWVR